MTITILLAWPNRALFPNRALGHAWQARHDAKRIAFEEGFLLARAQAGGNGEWDGSIPLTITFHPPDARRRDLDGLLSALKPHLDGIAHALGVDDAQFAPITLCWGERVVSGRVRVEIGCN